MWNIFLVIVVVALIFNIYSIFMLINVQNLHIAVCLSCKFRMLFCGIWAILISTSFLKRSLLYVEQTNFLPIKKFMKLAWNMCFMFGLKINGWVTLNTVINIKTFLLKIRWFFWIYKAFLATFEQFFPCR